jgi:DNA primase
MIKQQKIVEVRDRASIVEIISDYVTLKKAGRNYMGLCPFHGEKTPSFTVSEDKGIFHCFGCGVGGGVFHFLMRYDQLTFPEAVERVANRYGITIERADRSGSAGESGERELLYRLNERVAANYQKTLVSHPEGKRALEYLAARGVDEGTARNFMLGYAPQSGSGLLGVLKKEGLSVKDAMRLGLIGQRGSERFYEKFFGRLMFPIINAGGKVVGFGGRVLDQGLPKYLNSSETPLFRKSSTLYGLYQAKDGIRKTDRVVVVEGYLDAIALNQFGLADVVATLGTALTVEHVRLLSRYTKKIVALFDGDDAGRKAAARSFEIFIEAGMLGRAAFLPKSEDPDTFVRSRGKAAIEGVLDRAIPLADYYFSWLEERYGTGLEGKSQTAAEISRLLAKSQSPFDVDLLVRRAVDRLGIREELLRRPAGVAGKAQTARGAVMPLPSVNTQNREDRAERSLVSLMLRFPAAIREVEREGDIRQWITAKWQRLVDVILTDWQEQEKIDVSRIIQKLPADEAALISALVLESERVSEIDGAKMAADCVSHLRRTYLRGVGRNLRSAIRAAEEVKDEKAKRERILEWQEVVRKERQLERRRPESKTTTR